MARGLMSLASYKGVLFHSTTVLSWVYLRGLSFRSSLRFLLFPGLAVRRRLLSSRSHLVVSAGFSALSSERMTQSGKGCVYLVVAPVPL